jgi:hypothetical protein
MRSTLFQIQYVDAFQRAPHENVKAADILGSKSLRHAAGVAAPSQSRYATPTPRRTVHLNQF